MRGFCQSHGLSAQTTRKLLMYCDALWSERRGGIDRRAMLAQVPSHLIPTVAIELYKPLLASCPFLYDCTSPGCAAFLLALKVEVCDVGDELIVAGTLPSTMYILVRGELRINFEPHPQLHLAASLVPDRVGAPKAVADDSSLGDNRKVGMHGRTDRPGSLIGFQDPMSKPLPLAYSVRATTRSSLLSLSRAALRDVLTAHEADKPTFLRAIEHASTTLAPSKQRRVNQARTSKSDGGMEGAAEPTKTARGASGGGDRGGCKTGASGGGGDCGNGGVGGATGSVGGTDDAGAGGTAGSVAVSSEIAELRREVTELKNAMAEQTVLIGRLLKQQSLAAVASLSVEDVNDADAEINTAAPIGKRIEASHSNGGT